MIGVQRKCKKQAAKNRDRITASYQTQTVPGLVRKRTQTGSNVICLRSRFSYRSITGLSN